MTVASCTTLWCMKTTVYSWRVSPETKSAIESCARERGETIAALLDRITRDWLKLERSGQKDTDSWEAEVRARALAACGTIAGDDPSRAERSRHLVRRRLMAKHRR